jgi:hypothetical protein
MIVFGGYYKSLKSCKTFEYTFEANSWKEILTEDEEAKLKIDKMRKGMNEYDVITDTMMETCTNLPRPRTNHTSLYYKNGMYVFGGSDEGNNKLNDLWKFDLKKRRWIIINHIDDECDDGQPTKRSGHAANLIGNKMYIFGGLEGITQETNDFYSFDLDTETWTTIQLKVSNPENIKSLNDNKDSLQHSTFRDERKKSIIKTPNMALYGNDPSSHNKRNPLVRRLKEKTRNNKFLDAQVERAKFAKTFYNSPLRGLLTNIVIPNKIEDDKVEFSSPTTLALKSSIFLKINDGFDHAVSSPKKKKPQISPNADIKKTVRIPMTIPCPRDGATLTS